MKKLKGHTELRDIVRVIDDLAEVPTPANSVKLAGHPFRRVRGGDFRLVYAFEEERVLMLILKIGQRRDIYKSLEELRKIHRCNDILFFNDFAIRGKFCRILHELYQHLAHGL